MDAFGGKRVVLLIAFVLGFTALADANGFENQLVPPHSRSQHQTRARATRTARVDVDHAIEHIDDEHQRKQLDEHGSQVAFAAASAVVEPPAPRGERLEVTVLPLLVRRSVSLPFGRAPPQQL